MSAATWHVPGGSDELGRLLRDRDPDRLLLPTGAPPPREGDAGLAPRVEEALAGASAEVLSLAGQAGPPRLAEEDLTVTVPAGTRAENLEACLAEAGQWLPLPDGGDGRSAGGLVSAGGPGRYDAASGALGRQVLEVRLTGWDGTPYRWGRKVMKNVAGYDMVRLLCGSRGRAGVINEVTFRTWPHPARRRRYRLEARTGDREGDDRAAERAASLLLERAAEDDFRPDAATWTWRAGGGSACHVEFLGTHASVEARSRRLAGWAEAAGVRIEEVPEAEAAPGTGGDRRSMRARVRLRPDAGYLPAAMDAVRSAGDGRIRDTTADLESRWLGLTLDADGLDRVDARALLDALPGRDRVVDRGSPALHAAAGTGRSRAAVELERRVVDALRGRPRHWLADYV